MRISDWSSDVCSSDLGRKQRRGIVARGDVDVEFVLVIAERDIMQIGAVAEDRAKPAGRPGKRLEGDQLRLRPAGTRERAELTLVGADVDHGGGFDPDKRRPVLARGADGMRKRSPMAGGPPRPQRGRKFLAFCPSPCYPPRGV